MSGPGQLESSPSHATAMQAPVAVAGPDITATQSRNVAKVKPWQATDKSSLASFGKMDIMTETWVMDPVDWDELDLMVIFGNICVLISV